MSKRRPLNESEWVGRRVELAIGDPARGTVTFVDDPWIHWVQDGGRWVHASRGSVLKRIAETSVGGWEEVMR